MTKRPVNKVPMASYQQGDYFTVDMADFEAKRIQVLPPQWRYQENRARPRLLWLQRLLFKALVKLGALTLDEGVWRTEMNRITIRVSDILEKIFLGIQNVQEVLDREPNTLLLGPDEFRTVMGMIYKHESPFAKYGYIAESREEVYFKGRYRSRGKVFDLTIYMIPHMVGVLVL